MRLSILCFLLLAQCASKPLSSSLSKESQREAKLLTSLWTQNRGFLETENQLKALYTNGFSSENLDSDQRTVLKKMIKNNNIGVRYLYRYGDKLARHGNESEAAEVFQLVIEKDLKCFKKECLKSYIYLAALSEKKKNFPSAFSWLDQLAKNSFYEAASFYKARLHINLGQEELAQEELKKCLSLNPLEYRCHQLLVQVLQSEKSPELEKEILSLYAQHPSSQDALKEIFNFYMDQEDIPRAMIYLSELSWFEPHNLFIKFQLALHHEMEKQYDLSQDYMKQIQILEPDFMVDLGLKSLTSEQRSPSDDSNP